MQSFNHCKGELWKRLSQLLITNIKLNTDKTISEYVYYIDGVESHREKKATSNGYIFQNVPEGNKVINVTIW